MRDGQLIKASSFVVIGIVIGVVATLLLRPAQQTQPIDTSADSESGFDELPVVKSSAGGDNLTYAELLDENEELADLVAEMESLLLELRDSRTRTPVQQQPRVSDLPAADQTVSKLVAAGFTQERAEWIDRRAFELHRENVEAMVSLEAYARSPENLLRLELGDPEYERYLLAIGEIPAVRVGEVISSSPAALAGLSPGDQIMSYDRHRVFDIRELIALSVQKPAGQIVLVDILRDGDPMQLAIAGGALQAGLYSRELYAAPSFVPTQLDRQ
jgi:membrane-associated protease RseP (regulator of RpoE activity)